MEEAGLASNVSDGLAERLRLGDEHALAELFAAHRPRLWRLVSFRLDRRLGGRVDPDDVLQEAYLAAAQRLPHFARQSDASPFIWVRLIVQQTLIDVHRRHFGAQRRDAGREVPIAGGAWAASTSASIAVQVAGSGTSPSMAVARGEALEEVRRALDAMDPIDREVLALRHFEELTNTEVAEVLGIQVKAASIRYVRALRRLKQILAAAPASDTLNGQQDG
jgi:RNA polymerase sigma-70 factor (ECF subfamily)